MDTIEKVFMEILSNFNVKDLKYAIEKDVNLASLMAEKIPTIVKTIRIFSQFYNNQKDEVNANNIILYLSEKKPDFAQILATRQGRIWLDKNLLNVKRILFI